MLKISSQVWWLTPVILATQETKIRIDIQSQSGQMDFKTLSWKNPSQKKSGGMAEGVVPEFKLQHHKKKKEKISNL
jgi:hypothetical protein